jgi:NADH-quinone oxidoreductase subunit J
MLDSILFYTFAVIAVLSAALMVTRRNAMHSAVFLVTTLLATAGIFLQLRAEFLFVTQIIVYVGGIMVLFIFVIMLLNAGAETKKGRSYLIPGAPLLIVLLGLMAYYVQRMFPGSTMVRFGGFTGGGPRDIGTALFTTYLLPFEVTSILILIAIIGAIVLARKEFE